MPDLGSVISLQGLYIAIPLVALVLIAAPLYTRFSKKKKKKPGMQMRYTAPGKTAAACRGLLGQKNETDLFTYTLEAAASGGWYIHFTGHQATVQPLDTLFLMQFTADDPAAFLLTFVREAFGMKEPIIGEELLDAFFAEKLGALRAALEDDDQAPPAPM